MSEYPKTTEVQTIVDHEIEQVVENFHTHDNKATLDAITPELFADLNGLQQFEDQTQYNLQTMEEEILPLKLQAHTHNNAAVLDTITEQYMQDQEAFKTSTADALHGVETAISELSAQAHTHDNAAVLDTITEQYMRDQAAFEASTAGALHGLSTGLSEVSGMAHTHSNKSVLDQLTQDMIEELGSISTVVEQAHWHHNLTVLNSITAAKVAAWDKVSEVQSVLAALTERVEGDESENQQFQDQTAERLHTAEEMLNNFSNTAHTHRNKTVLDGITEAHINKWEEAYLAAMNLNERVGVNEGVFERFKTEILYDMTGCKTALTDHAARITALEQALSGVEEALAVIVEVTA